MRDSGRGTWRNTLAVEHEIASTGEIRLSDMAAEARIGSTAPRRRSGRVGEWLAALTVLLAVLGMAASSPPMVGPDEAAHQATASYLTVNILPPVAESDEYIAGFLKDAACMAFDATKDASCVPSRDTVGPAKVRVLNYPPIYYWAVGLGQKLAPEADTWMDLGGRAGSMLLNVGALVLLLILSRRRSETWGTNLLLVSTPMAVFLWAVVNPNGWEISSGLLFAYVFANAWWSSLGGSARVGWWSVLGVAATAVLFSLSRHEAIVWLALLVIAIALMGRSLLARLDQLKLLAASGVGVLAGLAWQVTHPAQHIDHNPDRLADPALGDYAHWLGQIDAMLPERLRQMVGVLGWLDTPVPQLLVFTLLISWAAFIGFLFARTRIPALALVVGFAGTFIVPSLLEVVRWNDWPYWYQGRITLAFTIPFLFVFVVRFGHHGRRAAVLLSLLSATVLTVMVWQNLMRYAYGVKDYLPLRWDAPAVSGLAFWSSVLIVVAMTVITIMRAWIFARERPAATSGRPTITASSEV